LPREPANIHQSPITKISHQPIEQIHVSSGSRVLWSDGLNAKWWEEYRR
jgi:hypothetical protein